MSNVLALRHQPSSRVHRLPVAQIGGATAGGAAVGQPPSIHLVTSSLPRRAWFEAWRAYNAGLYDIAPCVAPSLLNAPGASAWRLGSIVVGTMTCPMLSCRRERALIKQSSDHLLFRFYRAGGMRALLDGEPFEMRPGAFYVFDLMRSFNGVSDPSVACSVAIPYAATGYDPTRHGGRFSLGADTPAGLMLAGSLETLYSQAPQVSAEDGAALADGFVALVRSLLFPTRGDDEAYSAVERNRGAAIRRYVDTHFADPAISVEAVAHAIGASRATVFRVFARDRGFERAVIDRRLRAAATELGKTAPQRGAIGAVAARWGFSDPAWFARCCRERFGCSPSDILGLMPLPLHETASRSRGAGSASPSRASSRCTRDAVARQQ